MPFWPFNRPPPSLRIRQLRRDVDELNAELVDIRETQESIFAAVKRIQGKTYRRKRAEIEAEQPAAPETTDGEQPTGSDIVSGPQLPGRWKTPELLERAAKLRGR